MNDTCPFMTCAQRVFYARVWQLVLCWVCLPSWFCLPHAPTRAVSLPQAKLDVAPWVTPHGQSPQPRTNPDPRHAHLLARPRGSVLSHSSGAEETRVWVCMWGALCEVTGDQPQEPGLFLAWHIPVALFWEVGSLCYLSKVNVETLHFITK